MHTFCEPEPVSAGSPKLSSPSNAISTRIIFVDLLRLHRNTLKRLHVPTSLFSHVFSILNINESVSDSGGILKVSKGAKIRNRYNQVPHLTQDTNGKVTNSQLDSTNKSQEVSPFPAGDHKAQINRRVQRHSRHKTEKQKRSTKEVPPWNGQ